MAHPEQQALMRRLWADPVWRTQQIKQIKAAKETAARGEGFIYAAEIVGTDVVKLGFSTYPPFRIDAIRTSTKEDVVLLGYVPGTFRDELAMHRALREHRHPARPRCLEYYPRSILSHPAIPQPLRVSP